MVGDKPRDKFIKKMSRVLYFLSYLDADNDESQKLARDHEELNEIWKVKLNAKDSEFEAKGVSKHIKEEIKDFNQYKLICKKAESNNFDKITALWCIKKVFTVPWLIAYDHILV
jgi:hypothetical protein